MKLENLNVVELNALEEQQIEGGCWDCPGANVIKYLGHQAMDFIRGFQSAF